MKRLLFFILMTLSASTFMGCVATPESRSTPTPQAVTPPTPSPFTSKPNLNPTLAPIPTIVESSPSAIESPTVAATMPTPAKQTPTADAILAKLVSDAKMDLGERGNVTVDAIQVVSVKSVEWHDASLDCPKLGVFYVQVITPGYLIVLEAAGKKWNYHTSMSHVVYCDR